MKTALCKTYNPLEYGGSLYTTRYGRSRRRPLCTRDTIHLVLRSSRAVGTRPFRQPRHLQRIEKLLARFAARFQVQIVVPAIHHNHIHLQILLPGRVGYVRFIRALTAAIAMAVGGRSRWRKAKGRFWDRRPYTRIARGAGAAMRVFKYVLLNRMEAFGCPRPEARKILTHGGICYG